MFWGPDRKFTLRSDLSRQWRWGSGVPGFAHGTLGEVTSDKAGM
jgi:hypothetical protein